MSLLVFWTSEQYYDDLETSDKSFVFNQNNVKIFRIAEGQHVWTFTRRKDKTYVVASDLIAVSTKVNKHHTHDFAQGKYQVIGDRERSRYFNIEKGQGAELLIRSLSFHPQADILGESFQGENGVRQLSKNDEQKLITFASTLPTI